MIQKIRQKLKKYWRWFLVTICGVGIAFAAPILPDTVQEAFAKSELQDKYELIADKIVTKTAHINDAKVEINTLEPQATLSRWDNEVDIKIKPKGAKKQKPDFEREKIKFKEKEKEHHFYEVENGYEIETILLEKPNSNIVEYEIETKGLDFFYQPELTQEEIDEGAFRPENVIGSYAVYHSTKKDHIIGQKNYMAGKAFHIYRPLIIDANGAEVWGEMNIENGLLTVTVPQEFLDNAVYPVVVDPTFGYTTSGASETYFATENLDESRAIGNTFNLSENGTLDSLHASIRAHISETVVCDLFSALYREDSAGSGSHDLVVGIEKENASFSSDVHWEEFTASSEELTSDDYVLTIIGNGYDITTSGQKLYLKTDLTNERNRYYETSSGVSGYNTRKTEDPWTETASFAARDYSIYATYTATAAGTNMQVNISDAWKDVELMKINIGDVWKSVEGVKINIGDSWKTIY